MAIRERDDWRQSAEGFGFAFHTIEGKRYWDERAYYAFELAEIETRLEDPTAELHQMALALVDEVAASEELLTRLAIPRTYWDWIRDSWRQRQPSIYGRLDFAFDGNGPAKLYELNYDTPTSLYEAAFFQWIWLEQQIERSALPMGADQFNSIQERLIEAFGALPADFPLPLYFAAVRDSAEDQGTITYLRDCAEQAGLATESVAIEDIGLADDGRFTDTEDRVIGSLFKLYPLEHLFEEGFGSALPGSGVRLIEPPWKAILSNKGILPLLWERHDGHPNLLPAEFAEGPDTPRGWVRKPLFSREGANVSMHLADGSRVESEGPYGDGPAILQACHPLTAFDGNYPLIGSWVIGDQPAGIGIREDDSLITRDTSRFVPHALEG